METPLILIKCPKCNDERKHPCDFCGKGMPIDLYERKPVKEK